MKKFTKVISVVLCALLAVSVFTVGVSAKKAKKYVKSIKVTKKATITLGVKQKTVTKSYKVTVKVKGKASKKFTAKSSKASVASVKVSGSKIKVTAKKAGKATITVKTKSKGKNGKKLKAKLRITVNKKKAPIKKVKKAPGNTVLNNLKKLRDYIINNGSTNSDGNNFIKYVDYSDDEEYITGIIYDSSESTLTFSEVTDTIAVNFVLKLEENKSTLVSAIYANSESAASMRAEANIDIASLTKDSIVDFTIKYSVVSDYDTNNKFANSMLHLLMSGLNVLLLDVDMNVTDIGFINYK